MPEIAVVGTIGAIIVFVCVNINLYWTHRNFHSKKIFNLQNNLFLVEKYWSVEKGDIIPIEPGQSLKDLRKKDYKMVTRSTFIFGTFLIFLSWFGLLFFIIYLFSVHKFAKSRLEIKVFSSDLVREKINSKDSVQQIWNQITAFT